MFGKEPGEYILRVALPQHCTGALIGPKGLRIKAIREKTNAKLFVENDTHEGHQMVRILGSTEAILQAIPHISDVIDDEMPEDKLREWGAQMLFQEPGRGRKGAGGKRPPAHADRNHQPPSSGKGCKGGDGPKRRRSRSRSAHFEQDDVSEPSPWGPAEGVDGAPLEAMHAMMVEFPPGGLGMAHAVSCDLPNYRVGGLIGRRGEYIHHVQRETGTQVVFSELPKGGGEVTHRTMTVTGPLLAVYAAHMMMMRRFHEEEAKEEAQARTGRGGFPNEQEAHIENLQTQLADLERQLAEARGEPAGRAGRKGKGKR